MVARLLQAMAATTLNRILITELLLGRLGAATFNLRRIAHHRGLKLIVISFSGAMRHAGTNPLARDAACHNSTANVHSNLWMVFVEAIDSEAHLPLLLLPPQKMTMMHLLLPRKIDDYDGES
jgi:hypothetical protein